MDKKVLLIAGGGTLGSYTSDELLKLGCSVDVICLEDRESDDDKLRFFKNYATEDYLKSFFEGKHYDSIVNFVHYPIAEEYIKIHPLLISNTDHLVFVSSYRVYGNTEKPIKETSTRLSEIITSELFFTKEGYAAPKCQCEDFLKSKCSQQPWTVIRPVISFSNRRFDLFTYTGDTVLKKVKNEEVLILPYYAKKLTAGLDWAGNSGKLIARLCVNPETIGECYTISTGQNLTWGELADIYTELIGLKVKWVDEDEFLEINPDLKGRWHYIYDRKWDREIDSSKVLAATGLTKEDFCSIYEGIKTELKKVNFSILS